MAVNYESWYDLTKAVELMKPMATYFKDTFFSKSNISYNGFAVFEKSEKTDSVARFVIKDQNGRLVKKSGKQAIGFKLPTTKERMSFSIHEYNEFKTLGTKMINIGSQPSEKNEAFNQWVLSNFSTLKERVIRRQEQMCVEALTTGKLSIVDDDVTYEIDYDMPEANFITAAAAAKWSADTSNPIEDIIKYTRLISKKTGVTVDKVIMGTAAATAYRNNKTVKEQLNLLNYQVGSLQPTNAANITVGALSLGRLPSGIELIEYTQSYTDYTGTTKEMFDSNSIMLASSQSASRGFYEYTKGVINRFKKGTVEPDTPSVEFRAEVLTNEDNSVGTFQLEHCSMPIVKVPESIVIVKVV